MYEKVKMLYIYITHLNIFLNIYFFTYNFKVSLLLESKIDKFIYKYNINYI